MAGGCSWRIPHGDRWPTWRKGMHMAKKRAGKPKTNVGDSPKATRQNGRERLVAAVDKAILIVTSNAAEAGLHFGATGYYKETKSPSAPSVLRLRDRMLEVADEGNAYGAAAIALALGATLIRNQHHLGGLLKEAVTAGRAAKARNGRASRTTAKREAVREAAKKMKSIGITRAKKQLARDFGISERTAWTYIHDLF